MSGSVEGMNTVRSMTCGGSFSAALVAIMLLGGSTSGEAHPAPTAQVAVADTVPNTRLFERRLVPSTDYLNRALNSRIEVKAAVAPMPEELAAMYATRYRISRELALQIVETALAEGLDPELGFRIIRVESVFRVNARGSSGSLGLMQLMPGTARSIDRSLRTEAQIMEPRNNLRTGFRYLRQMIERYDGDVRLGVLAYNRGEVAVDRALRAGRDPENGYSPKVLGTLAAESRYAGPGLIARDN
jgi:soluble lytic murein transglycosylase-like protein